MNWNLDETYTWDSFGKNAKPATITIYGTSEGLAAKAVVVHANGKREMVMRGESAESDIRRWADDTAILLMRNGQ